MILFLQIGKDFPNLVVVMKLATTSPPSVTIHQGSATLKAQGTIDIILAKSINKPEQHLATVNLVLIFIRIIFFHIFYKSRSQMSLQKKKNRA